MMENPIGFSFSPQTGTKQNRHASTSTIDVQSSTGKRKWTPDDTDMENGSNTNDNAISTAGFSASKRVRNLTVGKPLPLTRLLENLDKGGLQELVKTLCRRHPGLTAEVYRYAPKPNVPQALSFLTTLEHKTRLAFPFGGDSKGEYAYNRVLPSIKDLLGALLDYTPHFLPPNEPYLIETLSFLDGATSIISRLPEWTNPNHGLIKREAYEEMNGAWLTAVKSADLKDQVAISSYVQKLKVWNELSKGLLETAFRAYLHCQRNLSGSTAHSHDQDARGLYT